MDTGDAMNTMVPLTFNLATQEAYDFYKDLYEELKLKIRTETGCGRERKIPNSLGRGTSLVVCPGRFPVLQ